MIIRIGVVLAGFVLAYHVLESNSQTLSVLQGLELRLRSVEENQLNEHDLMTTIVDRLNQHDLRQK
jgi:hypothetical protein